MRILSFKSNILSFINIQSGGSDALFSNKEEQFKGNTAKN
jgi:hypothetical protein